MPRARLSASGPFALALSIALAAAGGCCWKDVHAWVPRPSRDAAVAEAQQTFFKSLVYNCHPRSDVRAALDDALAAQPQSSEARLLDGLFWLWRSAEEAHAPAEERALILEAQGALGRYAALEPNDGRVPSWLEGARYRIARMDGDLAMRHDAIERLEDAHDRDPSHRLFHNLTLAFILFHEDVPAAGCPASVENEECRKVASTFCRGLCYLHENEHGCLPSEGCSIGMLWPHTLSGFLATKADYLLKAGDMERAGQLLQAVRVLSELAPFHYLVKDRIARPEEYARSFRDPRYPVPGKPHMIMDTPEVACRICHLSEQAERLSFVVDRPPP